VPYLVPASFRYWMSDACSRSIGAAPWPCSPVRRRTPTVPRWTLEIVLAFHICVTFCLDRFFHPGRQQL
jgi:hypothetical protein